MTLKVSNLKYNSQSKFPPMESDNYPARTVQVIDLGLQPQQPYQGQEKEPAYMIRLTYEFPTELIEVDGEDKPRWLGEKLPLFSLESERAKSTARYKALDPAEKFEGDWGKLVDIPCLVAVVQNESKGKIYNNIASVSQPVKGMTVPPLKNPVKVFTLDDPDLEVFNSLPQFIQDEIKNNLEFSGSPLDKLLNGTDAGTTEPAVEVEDSDIDPDLPV